MIDDQKGPFEFDRDRHDGREHDDKRPALLARKDTWQGQNGALYVEVSVPRESLRCRKCGWDNGASVSLERFGKQEPLAFFPCRDELAGQSNPNFRLSGYSFGSSNHKAQDLACLLELAWLLLHDSEAASDRQLAEEVAQAARHLQECRTRHGWHSDCAGRGGVGSA